MQNQVSPTPTNNEYISSDPGGGKSFKKILISLLPLFLGAGILVSLDQWTKNLVVENIPFLDRWLPANLSQYESFFRIVHWRNSGAAFGIFSNGNTIFLILAIIASTFIISFYPMIGKKDWAMRIAMILQLGGAVGNMIDRIRYGFVIDFISVKDFPVFNIADASISSGVAILLLGILIQEINEQKSKRQLSVINPPNPSQKKEINNG